LEFDKFSHMRLIAWLTVELHRIDFDSSKFSATLLVKALASLVHKLMSWPTHLAILLS